MRSLSSIVKAESLTNGSGKKESAEDQNYNRYFNPGKSNLKDESHQEMILQAIRKSRHIDSEAGRRAEAIIEAATQTGEQIKHEAEKIGFAEGLEKGIVEGKKTAERRAEAAISDLRAIAEAFKEDQRRQQESQQDEIIALSLAIAKKIMKQQIEVQENAIVKMLEDVIHENRGESSIKIFLSEYSKSVDFRVDKDLTEKIRNMARNISVTVVKDEDILMVETSSGIVDINMMSQLGHIEEAIKSTL